MEFETQLINGNIFMKNQFLSENIYPEGVTQKYHYLLNK